jgi:SAM-dependent methyltransferase
MSDFRKFQRWWLSAWPHRWHVRYHVPRFLKACPEPIRGEVLEIGAGGGWTSRQILETFPQVELTATDIDPDAMRTFDNLREQYGRRLQVREANALKLPFDRDSFDFAIAINVMPALTPHGVRTAVQAILRVLRPGGLLGISDHVILWLVGRPQPALVEEALQAEQCDIVYTRGDDRYDLWARKPYPLDENETMGGSQ